MALLAPTAAPPFVPLAAAAIGDVRTALVLYDPQEEPRLYAPTRRPIARTPTDFGLAYARQLQTLLGHFSFSAVTVQPIDAYRAGALDRYAAVFVIGSATQSRAPAALLDDVARTGKTVCWLDGGLNRFAARFDLEKKYGFRFLGRDPAAFRTVTYKGIRLDKTDPELFRVEVVDRGRVTIYATAVGDRGAAPYIIRAGNLWYVADNPMAYAGPTDRYLAFADVLHDVVDEPHAPERSALIRIEDISPLTQPAQLRAIADLLAARGIPFVVSVTPFHVQPAVQAHVSLSERPQLVEALRYMAARGGTIALHGSTHQYRGETGDDFEFWDAVYRRPIAGETAAYVAERIEDALAEAFRNNLYPLLWETPHYAASQQAYAVIARYFSSVIEQRQPLDDQRTSFFVPYLIRRDIYGQQIVPESLGFVAKETQSAEPILQAARAHLAVRDVVAGAFFHPFIRLDALQQVVEELQAIGYTFPDVRLLDHLVQSPDGIVATGKATVTLAANQRYLREFFVTPRGQHTGESVSTQPLTTSLRRTLRVPPRSIYVAQTSLLPASGSGGASRSGIPAAFSALWSRLRPPRSAPSEPAPLVEEARAAMLWDTSATGTLAGEQEGMRAALVAAGVYPATPAVDGLTATALDAFNLIVVPQAAARRLHAETSAAIVRLIRRGARLITTGRSPLAEALGVEFAGRSIRVKVLRDRLAPTLPVTWRFPGDLDDFTAPPDAEPVVTEHGTGRPVAIVGRLGRGAYLYFGSLFSTGPGYERFPFGVHHVQRVLRLGTRIRGEALEVFFDPGFRQNVSIERLVVAWRQQGVRVVHAAAWAFYPRYVYDYPRLIRSAHANGILVYAWFALPHLTHDFWLRHPQCREKDFRNQDAHPDWRFNLALTDRGCRDAVGAIVRDILQRYDWDGVNFAEIYFEAAAGFDDPRPLTPFHPSARLDFRGKHGFDPRDLFTPTSPYFWKRNPEALRRFEEFRVAWIVRLHDWALQLADGVRRAKPDGFEVIVTVVDELSMPVLRRSVGIDVMRILALRRRYDFALAAEDPTPMWAQPPWRYAQIVRRYRRILPEAGKLLIDMNILPFRPAGRGDYPTEHQGGLEVLQMVTAVAGAARVLLYAESTILEPDRPILPHALASVAQEERRGTEWRISTPLTLIAETDRATREVFVNGQPWPASVRGRTLLPPGQHRLSTRRGPLYIPRLRTQSLKLQKISAPEWQAHAVRDGLAVRYTAPTRTILVVTRAPREVVLDGRTHPTTPLAGDDGYAILLPAGTHAVTLRSVDTFTRPLDLAGFLLALAIGSFGMMGISALLLIAIPRLLRRGRFSRN